MKYQLILYNGTRIIYKTSFGEMSEVKEELSDVIKINMIPKLGEYWVELITSRDEIEYTENILDILKELNR